MQEITRQSIPGQGVRGQEILGQETATPNHTSSGLWFSPDYAPKRTSETKPAIQLPPGKPSIESTLSAPFTPAGLKIMIWSNALESVLSLEKMLHAAGYVNTSFALSHLEGMKKMAGNEYDFFIIDLPLEELGIKIVQVLRASSTYKETPMLICTESQQVQDMLRAMKAGANDLICKPINASLLTRKIALHSKMMPVA